MWEKQGEIKGDFLKDVAFDPPLNGRQSLSRWSWGARAFQAGRMAWARKGSWEDWSFHEQGRVAGWSWLPQLCVQGQGCTWRALQQLLLGLHLITWGAWQGEMPRAWEHACHEWRTARWRVWLRGFHCGEP